ncbi:hypothetical protein PVA17_10890 [Lysinibacillus sp. CNPSo 3705]|uniref:hypothetical protein n=1 Tax=Lysinibacillus sp. CNPSo 3705 TaxID=3028148 RepID=UPI0023640365|nr:hypothetical protein [Lysinibacillus sp. CNPSo 3705]MDD1503263.1 hypothetical protein [Lysinibacillus sp. CNPSo 3705]
MQKRSDSNKCFYCAKAQCNEASATNVLPVRKRSETKRQQQQSAQPERKSTSRYEDNQL